MNDKCLIDGPIKSEAVARLVEESGRGGHSGGQSFFIGRVRADLKEGKIVKAIEYSAYENMVQAEAEKIKNEILSEFTDAHTVDILHSTGVVRTGEVSLLVVTSAGHRHHAVEACRKTVELIKERLPVWKKEIYDDDSSAWKQNNTDQIEA